MVTQHFLCDKAGLLEGQRQQLIGHLGTATTSLFSNVQPLSPGIKAPAAVLGQEEGAVGFLL